MSINAQNMDPRCLSCEEKDCANCTRFGTRSLLTAPVLPWPPPDGQPIRRPKTPSPWEKLPWMKK